MRETSESSDTPIEREGLESTIRQRRLTPEERDAIVREYNEELLTPHERESILGKVKAELQASDNPDRTVKDCKRHAMTSVEARPKSKRVTPNEVELILKLREHGMSYDQIGLHLWRHYSISRNKSSIGRIIRQNQPESKEQS